MILAQLKAHLAAQGPAGVAGLAARFEVAPAAMEAMLGQLMRRGLVRRSADGGACGGCTRCDLHAQELFEWADSHHGKDRCAVCCETGPFADSAQLRR